MNGMCGLRSPLHGWIQGHSPLLHICQKVADDNISVRFLEKSRCCFCNNFFKGKFGSKQKRLRFLNSDSFPGNIRGHVPHLPRGKWKVCTAATGPREQSQKLCIAPAYSCPGLTVQCKAVQILGTSIFPASLRTSLRDLNSEIRHFLYNLLSGEKKKKGDSAFIVTLQ